MGKVPTRTMGARMFFPLKHSGVFTVIPAVALSEREHRGGGGGKVMKYYLLPGNSQNFSSGGTEAVEPHVAARRLGASSPQSERSPEPTTVGGSPYGGTTLPGAESTLRAVKAGREAAAGLPPHRSSPSSRGAG